LSFESVSFSEIEPSVAAEHPDSQEIMNKVKKNKDRTMQSIVMIDRLRHNFSKREYDEKNGPFYDGVVIIFCPWNFFRKRSYAIDTKKVRRIY